MSLPLEGYRVGVTASRKVQDQVTLLERRGASVAWAPALSTEPYRVDDRLQEATREVLARPVDILVATTGVGMTAWFEAAEAWGLRDELVAHLAGSAVIARGPKTVGALRRHGVVELWSAPTERLDEVLDHLRGTDLAGKRIVVQEHGQSLSVVAAALERRGADVTVVTVYRISPADDPEPLFAMVDSIADRALHAVTFTSAPAVVALMEVATAAGRRDDVVDALRTDVLAACVGPVTAEAFEPWGVPTVQPARSRTAAMVTLLETELPRRRSGVSLAVAGRSLVLHGDAVRVDGQEVRLSGAPLSVLRALAADPGHVVSRAELLTRLPSGTAASEHAVEMAVARLRSAIGADLVRTVVKRGYRLAVDD